jgi:hypothetical protein
MTSEKYCPVCKQTKPIEAFWSDTSTKDGHHYDCSDCSKKRNRRDYRKHILNRRKSSLTWKWNNMDKVLQWQKAARLALRSKILAGYGGRCTCCGETEEQFLTIEHINGGGRKHRKRVGSTEAVSREIIRAGFPNHFTILCMNCNWARRRGTACPHENKPSLQKKNAALVEALRANWEHTDDAGRKFFCNCPAFGALADDCRGDRDERHSTACNMAREALKKARA